MFDIVSSMSKRGVYIYPHKPHLLNTSCNARAEERRGLCVLYSITHPSDLFRMALGMFDPAHLQPYLNISTDQVNSPAHQVREPLQSLNHIFITLLYAQP